MFESSYLIYVLLLSLSYISVSIVWVWLLIAFLQYVITMNWGWSSVNSCWAYIHFSYITSNCFMSCAIYHDPNSKQENMLVESLMSPSLAGCCPWVSILPHLPAIRAWLKIWFWWEIWDWERKNLKKNFLQRLNMKVLWVCKSHREHKWKGWPDERGFEKMDEWKTG